MSRNSNQVLIQQGIFSDSATSLEVCQAFMTGYVRRINDATLRVTIGGVKIGSAKYSRLAQINLQTRVITFSRYAIENVPERGRRYLVIHELAHVREPSHNKRFWQIVARYEPNYRQIGKAIQLAFNHNVKQLESTQKYLKSGFSQSNLIENSKLLFASHINSLENSLGLNYHAPHDNRESFQYVCSDEDLSNETMGIIHGGSDISMHLSPDN